MEEPLVNTAYYLIEQGGIIAFTGMLFVVCLLMYKDQRTTTRNFIKITESYNKIAVDTSKVVERHSFILSEISTTLIELKTFIFAGKYNYNKKYNIKGE